MPERPIAAAHGLQQQAERDDPRRAEARDQRAGEEARPVHRHDVPLNAEIGIADAEAAHLHGQRRRGHHQVHHRIGDDAAQRGGDEARLPHDLEQRPAAVQIGRRRLRRIDAGRRCAIATSATAACTRKLKANR